MTAEINKVEFGVSNLHLAENMLDGTYGALAHVEGTVSISLSAISSKKETYADNGVFFEITKNGGYEGELEIYNYDDDFKVKYFGFIKDSKGVLLEPEILVPKAFAMAFQIEGDKSERTSIMYNVVFEKPDVTHKTTEEEIEIEALKCKFKATPVKFEGKKYIQASTTDSTLQTAWFTTVYIPTFTGI